MREIIPFAKIVTPFTESDVYHRIVYPGRICYKSGDKENKVSDEDFIRDKIKRGHESIIEHVSFSVHFVCDRGVSHEIVRHRIASYSQESTRYCNYSKQDAIDFIKPVFWERGSVDHDIWVDACIDSESAYFHLMERGATPQQARSVLNNSLKTELYMTANLRAWRHFFKLRAVGTSGAPHPQMLELTVPLLQVLHVSLPAIFDDLVIPAKYVDKYGKQDAA